MQLVIFFQLHLSGNFRHLSCGEDAVFQQPCTRSFAAFFNIFGQREITAVFDRFLDRFVVDERSLAAHTMDVAVLCQIGERFIDGELTDAKLTGDIFFSFDLVTNLQAAVLNAIENVSSTRLYLTSLLSILIPLPYHI